MQGTSGRFAESFCHSRIAALRAKELSYGHGVVAERMLDTMVDGVRRC